MQITATDILFFAAFFAVVVGVSLWKSRRRPDRGEASSDYFLAGRGLTWPLIGISIVAANISTEQMVGMAGQGAGSVGLAVSAWQLIGSLGIVVIAFTLLPKFLRAGIYTMPEFLEYRYNPAARGIMAVLTVVIYVAVLVTAVLYSGGLTLQTIFDIPLAQGVWLIGGIATLYTAWGGLKAIAWADLFQGLGLILGGLLTFWLGLKACGGWEAFSTANADKLHMILPADNPDLPWTGVASGMWIVILYYCGLNQFIVQRNLAAKTLRDGQLGVIFAGALWLLVPFAIVMPGIMAMSEFKPEIAAEADRESKPLLDDLAAGSQEHFLTIDVPFANRRPNDARKVLEHNAALVGAPAPATANAAQLVEANTRLAKITPPGGVVEMKSLAGYKYDSAFPVLIRELIPEGIRGFMFAAIAGAVVSSLASMLNSASTIFTLDIFKRHFRPGASEKQQVLVGRVATLAAVVCGCLLAPQLAHPKFGGVFQYIQQFQGYIWPGVVAAFVMAFLLPRAPGAAGVAALVAGPLLYAGFQFTHGAPGSGEGLHSLHFLVEVFLTFLIVAALMCAIALARPLRETRTLPVREDIELHASPAAKIARALVILGVVAFFVVFR